MRNTHLAAIALTAALTMILVGVRPAVAASAQEIDLETDAVLERFKREVDGGAELLDTAKGVLAFPSVIKAGIGIGGEYGEGALRIGGKTVDYYSTASASVGLQLGVQSKAVILLFLAEDALGKFRRSAGWEVGVDGSVALLHLGAGGSVDTTNIKDPIVGFVMTNAGLMYNLSLEGTKMTKIKR